MYIKPIPIGINQPIDEDRKPIWRVTSGDDLCLTTMVSLSSGEKATLSNSNLHFVLAETRFHFVPIWEGTWRDGIEEVDPINHPGLVKIKIPDDIGDTLRRGVYSFSMTVSDRFGKNTQTVLIGNLLIEYEPSSPEHDIPYKKQTGEE